MKSFKVAFIVLMLALPAIACGVSYTSASDSQSPDMLAGDVTIDGSSTVFPIMTAAAEEYNAVSPLVRVTVGESGTGGGFKKFCGIDQAPSTDISNASRPIKPEEADACQKTGVEYVELLVAFDGLTVVVNPSNDFVQCLTLDQLGAIFRPEDAQNADTWAQVDPAFPDKKISFFVPDPDSGTRDYFVEVIAKHLSLEGDAANIRQDDHTTFSTDDNVLLEGVAGEEDAVGFFGYAYYVGSADRVRAVAIQNKAGDCILPSDQTVGDGSYNPLSRPLFIYVNKASLNEKPQVADFVNYLLTKGLAGVVAEVGYSQPPSGTYSEGLSAIAAAMNK